MVFYKLLDSCWPLSCSLSRGGHKFTATKRRSRRGSHADNRPSARGVCTYVQYIACMQTYSKMIVKIFSMLTREDPSDGRVCLHACERRVLGGLGGGDGGGWVMRERTENNIINMQAAFHLARSGLSAYTHTRRTLSSHARASLD